MPTVAETLAERIAALAPERLPDAVRKTAESIVLDITGRTPQGEVVFVATLTPVCVARDERRSIEIPAAFRQLLLDYRDACNGAAPQPETTHP